MAHKNPEQLGRLLAALQHDDFHFFIHLDSKCNIADYEHLTLRPRVQFTARRFAVRWASYHFTHAIIECTRDILAGSQPFDFINLLSGQDYPIKPAAAIHDFFARHKGYSFLSFEQEGSPWWQHATSRIERYHTTYYQFRGQYVLQKILNWVLPRRRFPLPYALYGGSDGSWWTLDATCAAYLVRFIDAHAKLRRFSKLTWGSDEFLITTVLMNSHFKSSIINENYRYIDWSAGGANPRLLTTDDFPKLAHAHKLFARKFDADYDQRILNLLDTWLLRPRPRAVAAG